MKRKILIAIYIILILITLKLIYNTAINNILISKYNNGKYEENQAKALTYLNYYQSYVANYNYGNILYQNGEYEKAIEQYKKALNGVVPKYKECNIRINCALAICKTVNLDENDPESIENAINTYESAIDILTEEGCANKNDNNGHNQNAEQLKKDIQKEIDRLKNLEQSKDNTNPDSADEEKEEKTDEEVETIEDKIQDIKDEATREQREVESLYEDLSDYSYTTDKNW